MPAKEEVKVVSDAPDKESYWNSQRTRTGIATVIALVILAILRSQFPLMEQYLTAEQFAGLVQAISIIVGSWLVGRSLRNTRVSK